MTTQTFTLHQGTVGELRKLLNRHDLHLRDDTAITLSITGFVGEDNPHADHGYDEFRIGVRKVTIIDRPGTVQPQVVRLS